MMEIYKIVVNEEDVGQRLDKLLVQKLPDLTRTRIKNLIDSGHVVINGSLCTQTSKKNPEGTEIEVQVPEIIEAEPLPQKVDFEVVFEDDDVIVINKPVGLVVHPGAGNQDGTLVNGLLYHCKDSLSGIGGVKRPGIVHRLDKGTSGLMVVAKNDTAHHFLSDQFIDRTLKRTYIAICWGVPNPLSGTITGNIGRDPRSRQKMKVVGHGGKEAITNYEMLERVGKYCSLVQCSLETGRTHQIRVHLTEKGNSIVGDPVYGRKPRGLAQDIRETVAKYTGDSNYPALHATELRFIHPKTEELLEFKRDAPQDFKDLLEYLGTIDF